jgi:hypothetical protein
MVYRWNVLEAVLLVVVGPVLTDHDKKHKLQ